VFYLFWKFFYEPDSWLRFLRLFKNQPFRALCAAVTAFFIVHVLMPWFIRKMKKFGVREQARHYSELDSGFKSAVPTMGGIVILLSIVISSLLWCDPLNKFVLITLFAGIGGAALGMADDVAKIKRRSSDSGLSRGPKYLAQFALGAAVALFIMLEATSPIESAEVRHSFYFPFLKIGYNLGWFNFAVITIFIVFATNAVNLTDGMDGLAAAPSGMLFLTLAFFAYVIGHATHAIYLQFFPYIEPNGLMANHSLIGAGELAVLCCAGAGAAAGFLWDNAFPATIMMGDTGSLALGAMLGAAAASIRQEFVFIIAGGAFVIELLSSFVQDYVGLKLLGRRIFFRAPFHSTMLHWGISESKVTIRFWLISAALSVIALSFLKLR